MTYAQLPKTETEYDWLLQRNTGIGSSDASTIMGLSPYQSPYSLWEVKTGRAPLDPPVSDRQQELRDMGHAMEPVIRDLTAQKLGISITKGDVSLASTERPWQHFSPDGITSDGRIFEAKNVHWRKAAEWDGQIPDHAEIQVHHGAAVTGMHRAIVTGLIGGNELSIHEIDINPNVVDIITEAEASFWEHVEKDTPPPLDGHVRTMESLTREWAHHPGVKEISASEVEPWLIEWLNAKKEEAEAKARKTKAAAHIGMLMEGHDRLMDGKRLLARAQRGQLSLSKLRGAHPDLVEQYMTTKPAFDLERFKEEQADLYTQFQTVSIRPQISKGL